MNVTKNIFLSGRPFKVLYKGKKYKIKGVVKLSTKLTYPDIYYKVKFEKHGAGMFFVPSTNDFFIS